MTKYPPRPLPYYFTTECDCGHSQVSHGDSLFTIHAGQCNICMCPKFKEIKPSSEIQNLRGVKQ